jgi:hypothetical protein
MAIEVYLANRSGGINRGVGPRTTLIGCVLQVAIGDVMVGNVDCVIGVDSNGCTGSNVSI